MHTTPTTATYLEQLREMLGYKETSSFYSAKAEQEKLEYQSRLQLALCTILCELEQTAELVGYFKSRRELEEILKAINKSTQESFSKI